MMRLFRTKKNNKSPNFSAENNRLFMKELIKSFGGKRNPILIFTAQELAEATNNFDGFSIMYRNGFSIWCKRKCGASHSQAILVNTDLHKKEKMNELVMMSQINHKNVVKLWGGCLETEVPILVFEYFQPSGTLHNRILGHHEGKRPLTWVSRLRIATEIAHAVTYLHSLASRPIIHRDIKLENIILDEQDAARLFDFSLSILIPMGQSHVQEDHVVGTYPYVDPGHVMNGIVRIREILTSLMQTI